MPELSVRTERWPVRGVFRISRGSRSEVLVVVAELREGELLGRGECVPYARYGETVDGVAEQLRALGGRCARGLDRTELAGLLPAGAARNALDCALWDLQAKRSGQRVWHLAGLAEPVPLVSAYTLSLDEARAMGAAAREQAGRPLLKLKLAGEGDLERVQAVREAAPRARLIVDANEAWSVAQYRRLAPALAELGVELIEQPFPADADAALAGLERPVPVCADESCHEASGVAALADRYDSVNLKLDKTGGLTEALAARAAAAAAGLGVMVGCMVGTSLAMAPAVVLGQGAEYVDLDGPLLLARDRSPGLRFRASEVWPPAAELWG